MTARSRRPRVPEKAEQAHIVQLLKTLRCRVWVAGTRRPKGDYQGTCQTPGIPDLTAFLPDATGILFVEVKAAGGCLRPEQEEFRELVLACEANGLGVHHIVGGCDAVIAWLMTRGLLKPDQVPHYRVTYPVTPQCGPTGDADKDEA